MSARFWEALDTLAHKHKRLVPRSLRAWICDRYDLALGCTPGELRRTAPVACEPTPEDHALADAAMAHAATEEMDGDGPPAWFATVPALKGVWGAGDSPDEALADLRESIPGWLAVRRELELDSPPAAVTGKSITEDIDADPAEAGRLRQSRQRARAGDVTGRYDDA